MLTKRYTAQILQPFLDKKATIIKTTQRIMPVNEDVMITFMWFNQKDNAKCPVMVTK